MLTASRIASLKPRPNVYRVADREGLCVEVRPSGLKLWRYRFRLGGRGQMLALGRVSDISLREARELANQARQLVEQGRHPLGLNLSPAKTARQSDGMQCGNRYGTRRVHASHTGILYRSMVRVLGNFTCSCRARRLESSQQTRRMMRLVAWLA